MSSIYLDPVRMDATAGAVGEHAREVEDAVATLETSCSADVPLYLAGWLAEELRDIAVHARLAALLYTVAALDTAVRAQQIQADQSLVAAQPPVGTPIEVNSMADLGAVLAGSTVVGGSFGSAITMTIGGAGSYGGLSEVLGLTTTTIGPPTLANDPLLAMASRVQDSNPALAAQLAGVHGMLSDSTAESGRRWTNSRPGASYIGGGLYEGDDGRTGALSSVYRNPDRPGEYEVRP